MVNAEESDGEDLSLRFIESQDEWKCGGWDDTRFDGIAECVGREWNCRGWNG